MKLYVLTKYICVCQSCKSFNPISLPEEKRRQTRSYFCFVECIVWKEALICKCVMSIYLLNLHRSLIISTAGLQAWEIGVHSQTFRFLCFLFRHRYFDLTNSRSFSSKTNVAFILSQKYLLLKSIFSSSKNCSRVVNIMRVSGRF